MADKRRVNYSRLLGGGVVAVVLLLWMRKGKVRENELEKRIRAEGGTITGRGTIGFLFVDPFKHTTTDATGHTITVRYDGQAGEKTGENTGETTGVQNGGGAGETAVANPARGAGGRTGTWFVRTSSRRPEGEWLWVDAA